MIELMHRLFETVGLAGLAALWVAKALFGVAILRAVRPAWVRIRGGKARP